MTLISRIIKFIKKHPKRIILLVIVIAAIGFWVKPKLFPTKPTERAMVTKKTLVSSIEAEGKTEAGQKANLHFSIPSKLVWLGVKKGDKVKKWQAVASLDKRIAQKNLGLSLLDFRTARSNFDQRYDDLDAEGKKIDDVHDISDTNKRVLEREQFGLDKAVKTVEVQSIVASDATLISPIEGTVIDISGLTVGENLLGSDIASRGIKIVDLNSLYFRAEVDEVDYHLVKVGQKVLVSIDAFPGERFEGEVVFVGQEGSKTNSGSVKVPVDIKLNKLNDRLITELAGEAEFVIEEKQDVIAIPKSMVKTDNEGKYVHVWQGRVVKRKVVTGIETDTQIEIKEGLSENEEVVLAN